MTWKKNRPAGVLYPEHDEAILILTCGRNNTTSVSEVENNVKSIVSYLKPLGALPCICPQFTPVMKLAVLLAISVSMP